MHRHPDAALLPRAWQLRDTGGVTVTPAGVVYVSDFMEHRLLRYLPDGSYDGTCGQARFRRSLEPRSAAATPDGLLLVADRSRIRRFGPARIEGAEQCLDQFVILRRIGVDRASLRTDSPRIVVRSSVRATATIRVYARRRGGAPHRLLRRTVELQAGTNELRLGTLREGLYRVTVDASDDYGNDGRQERLLTINRPRRG